jgi:hypothetical protein
MRKPFGIVIVEVRDYPRQATAMQQGSESAFFATAANLGRDRGLSASGALA